MGFLVDAGSILLGGLLGGLFSKKLNFKTSSAFAIGIMLISIVGLMENILRISEGRIVGEHTVIVVIALIAGCALGDALKIEDRLYSLTKSKSTGMNGFIDAVLFFGIGGLQISGPMLYALKGDSFQLILKGIIDFPFALILGATYGKKVALSAPVVAFAQILIAILAYYLGGLISESLLCQLCSLGYVILFFSGFNMLCPSESKIKNINMLPGVLLIIIYHVIKEICLS